jgi:serine/threonine protein kinase
MKTIEKGMAMRAGQVRTLPFSVTAGTLPSCFSSPCASTDSMQQLSLPLERHLHRLAQTFKTPSIPHLIAAFQSPDSLHLLTTYAACGTLWDRLCEMAPELDFGSSRGGRNVRGKMREGEIKWWAAQMVQAIDWVHVAGYTHR